MLCLVGMAVEGTPCTFGLTQYEYWICMIDVNGAWDDLINQEFLKTDPLLLGVKGMMVLALCGQVVVCESSIPDNNRQNDHDD